MNQPPRLDPVRLWNEYGKRLVRYGGVTVVTTIVGLTTLLVGLYVFDWPPVYANLVSVFMSTPFAYYLNRRFVWEQSTGNHSVSREVGPFWIMTFIGFVVSTSAVGLASLLTEAKPLLLLTQLAAFAGLWLVKFAFLEKYLWPDTETLPADPVRDAA